MIKLFLATAVASLLATAAHAATTTGTNLVVNGDAEAGDTSGWTNTNDVKAVTEADNAFTEVANGDYAFSPGLVGPSGRSQSSINQEIQFFDLADEIDAGGVGYTLSGQLQQRSGDAVKLSAFFLDANLDVMGGPVELSDPSTSAFDYNMVEASGMLLAGTRAVVIELFFSRTGGRSTDGFADDVSFVLTNETETVPAVPLPAGLPLLLAGVGALVALRRRGAPPI